jgi:arylsulfatase A-like enzyme
MRFGDYAVDYDNDYDAWLAEQTGGRVQPALKALHGNSLITEPWTHDESLHLSNWTTAEAIRMLDTRDPTRPFFLNLAYHRPHPPFDPPVEYWDRFRDVALPEPPVGDWLGDRFDEPTYRTDAECGNLDPRIADRARRGYYASIAHVDAQIGRVITWLWHRQMLDETLIIFSTDHGEQLGDHRQWRKSSPLAGSLSVPMIVRPPKSWAAPAGQIDRTPVALHDVMPTLLDACDVPIPDGVEGQSFLPIARGEGTLDRPFVHAEMCSGPLGPWQCLVGQDRKYVWFSVSGEELLFDTVNDPQETHNLAGEADYQDELITWRKRLAEVLADRPEDGMSDGETLIPGHGTPAVRPWLLEEIDAE